MNKMLVVVFNNETDAYNGLTGLKGLHIEGAITLYKHLVVTKNESGEVSVKEGDSTGPVGTAVGIALGGLVGLMGGPIGALAGAYGGSLAGVVYDLTNAGVDAEFIDDIANEMRAGSVALLADIDETWTTPLDTQMMDANGIVFRKLRAEVEEDQIEREVKATREELAQFEAELNESAEEFKANIQKHIDAANTKMNALAARAEKKQKELSEEFDNKIETLNTQRKEANEKNKAKIDATIEKLKKDHASRIDKLKRAYAAAKSELNK